MTEQDYRDLAAACDRLLRSGGSSLDRIAVPSLHVINEHPGSLRQYAGVLDPQARLSGSALAMTDSARAVVRVGRAFTRAAREPTRMPLTRTPQNTATAPVDVLILSRLVDLAQLETGADFYFGALQELLRERGATSQLVFVNHLPPSLARSAPTARRRADDVRAILPQALPPLSEMQIWRRCGALRRDLRRLARTANTRIARDVALLASRDALSWGTAGNLRLHACVAALCRRLAPRIVITTYEGDASERMIWHAARTHGQQPLCAGYQHTRLLERAHAIRRSIRAPGIPCDPDVILTSGEIPHAALRASSDLGPVRLIAYGSHRRSDSSTETSTARALAERPRVCLVLPDADESESRVLFEFAARCARYMPDMHFVLRPHPTVSLAGLQTRHELLRNLPGNVTLSREHSLAQECAQARYCLYRGSSAALHAVLGGLRPFYLARRGELPFDPLFALREWRETVGSPEEFARRVRDAEIRADPEAAARAWSFCDRYVSRVRPAALDELLDAATSRSAPMASAG
jgi:hypothetical protein